MAQVAELRSWYEYLQCSRYNRLEPGKPLAIHVITWTRERSTSKDSITFLSETLLIYYIFQIQSMEQYGQVWWVCLQPLGGMFVINTRRKSLKVFYPSCSGLLCIQLLREDIEVEWGNPHIIVTYVTNIQILYW